MNYFFTKGISTAADYDYAKYQLLNQKKKTYLVTTDYDRFLSQNLNRLGILTTNTINLFDRIQNVTHIPAKKVQLDDLNIVSDIPPVKVNADTYGFYHEGYCFCTVKLFSDTAAVDQINYYDRFANLLEIDSYDVRGFKSITTVYGQNGGVATDNMYTPDEKLAYEEFYQTNPQTGKIASSLSLVHGEKCVTFYDTRTALIAKFYQTLNTTSSDTFYATQSFLNQYNFVADPSIQFLVAE